MSEPVARYYDEHKNPDGGYLPGVPLRDLTQAEYDALLPWLQAGVDDCPFYSTTAPTSAPAPGKASTKPKE